MPIARLTRSTVMRSACSARSTPGSSIMPPGWWRIAPSTASSKFDGGTWLAAGRRQVRDQSRGVVGEGEIDEQPLAWETLAERGREVHRARGAAGAALGRVD